MRFDLLNQQISPHVMTIRPCPTPPAHALSNLATRVYLIDHAPLSSIKLLHRFTDLQSLTPRVCLYSTQGG